MLGWVKEALAEHELADKIRHDVSEGLEARQREFLLRQQMDAIRKELGEDGGDDLVGGYRERLAKLVEAKAVTDDTRKAIEREVDRLERTPEQNTEHGWIRNWLDTVFEIPWGERGTTTHRPARQVLDEDHTGLDEVKDRIVEMLAVRKLLAERAAESVDGDADTDAPDANADGNASDGDASDGDDASERPRPHAVPDVDGSGRKPGAILALAGPPGVGKTSLGASVARARRFTRVALGASGTRRRSGATGAPTSVPSRGASSGPAGGRDHQPRRPARRGRQARRRLARRSLIGTARGPRPGAEPHLP